MSATGAAEESVAEPTKIATPEDTEERKSPAPPKEKAPEIANLKSVSTQPPAPESPRPSPAQKPPQKALIGTRQPAAQSVPEAKPAQIATSEKPNATSALVSETSSLDDVVKVAEAVRMLEDEFLRILQRRMGMMNSRHEETKEQPEPAQQQ